MAQLRLILKAAAVIGYLVVASMACNSGGGEESSSGSGGSSSSGSGGSSSSGSGGSSSSGSGRDSSQRQVPRPQIVPMLDPTRHQQPPDMPPRITPPPQNRDKRRDESRLAFPETLPNLEPEYALGMLGLPAPLVGSDDNIPGNLPELTNSEAFKKLDLDEDGKISVIDWKLEGGTVKSFCQLLSDHDADGDEMISLKEFQPISVGYI